MESGNAALRAKQYDKAIEFYDAGLRIAPRELVLLNNKSTAIRLRAVDLYNTSIKLESEQAKTAGFDAAKKDFLYASTVSSEAVKILKSKSPIEVFILESIEDSKTLTLESHAENMRLLATIADSTKADEALQAIHEYTDIQTDQDKRLKAQLNAGKMMIDTRNGQKAFVEYKRALDINPNSLEATLGAGMALAQSGQKEDFRKAKPYIQRFVDQAPADHPSMTVAKEILSSMQ